MRHHRHQQGSVVIVALCFVAVLGIGLAAYMGVSNQAMKLSNRSYVKGVSEQLAEMGLERALLAFNQNYWDTAIWSDQNPTTRIAKGTITFPNTKYGNGVTGSINLRVDHYSASVWNAATIYNRKDIVSYRGVWFLCKLDNISGTPPQDSSAWVSAPGTWSSAAIYQSENIAIFSGTAYRCILANSNQPPPNTSYWQAYSVAPWNSATSYSVDDVTLSGGTAYRCIAGNANQAPPNLNYWASEPVIYAEGVATLPDNSSTKITTQLRALIAPAALFPNAAAASGTLTLNSGGTVDSYDSSLGSYNSTALPFSTTVPNVSSSAVLSGGNPAATSVAISSTRVSGYVSAPAYTTAPFGTRTAFGTSAILTKNPDPLFIPSPKVDPTLISRSPFIPQFEPATWNATKRYRKNDVVRYGVTLYLCTFPNINQPPPNANWTEGTLVAFPLPPSIANPDVTTSALYHIEGDLSLASSGDILNINGPGTVILDIKGYLSIQNGWIKILNNGSAQIHVRDRLRIGTAPLFSPPPTGGIDNTQNKTPKNLIVVGTSTSTSTNDHRFRQTSQPFYGAIYLPYSHMDFRYGGQIFGAVSAKSINFSNDANLHYDTSLRTATFRSIDAPFIITEWRELTDAAERVTLP